MSDVAKLAGVSHQTVSRVINGADQVREETRERVLAAMRMLDYRPNPVARALVTGRSKTIGVVSFDTTLYGPASTLFGIERAAHEEGYFTSIVSLKSLDRPSVLTAVERLRGQAVDGILVDRAAGRGGARRRAAAGRHGGGRRSRPARTTRCRSWPWTSSPARRPPRATCWSSATGRSGTSPGPADWHESRQRIAGWRHALEEAGAEAPPPLVGRLERARRLRARAAADGRAAT